MKHLLRNANYYRTFCGADVSFDAKNFTIAPGSADCTPCVRRFVDEQRPGFVPVCIMCGEPPMKDSSVCRSCMMLQTYA